MRKTNIYFMTTCSLMAALMCIFGPVSVPIGPVPVSLTNFILYFAIFLLGTKGTLVSYIVYFLLGAFGLPVFSGGAGGLGKIAGPTGGYLVGFIPMVMIAGAFYAFSKRNLIITYLGMVLGTLVAYLLGTIWFMVITSNDFVSVLSICVFPFIPFDLMKMLIACILGTAVRKALVKANLL